MGAWALDALRSLRRPYGFDASDRQTGSYAALFGRDSLWVLLFLLEAVSRQSDGAFAAWVRDAGRDVLGALSRLQGRAEDDRIEEQPGKIVHEYRETIDQRLLDLGIPFHDGRSYAGFDQTFLFVTAYAAFAARFPDDPSVDATWPAVERAVDWIERYGDEDRDGLFEYRRRHPANLLNQSWRDSFDSLVGTGVDVPPPPVAWIEVQAYAYRALLDAAELFGARGDRARAGDLTARADRLRHDVHAAFWLDDERCFALALDGRKRPIRWASSNAGHALWAGLVDDVHADALVARLAEPDLLTPFGLRSLSARQPAYAPFTHHRGNVWPFDNAIVALGLERYGRRPLAAQLMNGVARALLAIGSPVELYVVLDGDLFVTPRPEAEHVLLRHRVPQENRIQAWSAAALVWHAAAAAPR